MPAARDLADLRCRPVRRSLGGVFVLLMVLLGAGFTLSLGTAWVRPDLGHVRTITPRTDESVTEPLLLAGPATAGPLTLIQPTAFGPLTRTRPTASEPLTHTRPATSKPPVRTRPTASEPDGHTAVSGDGGQWRTDVLRRLWSFLAVIFVSGSAAIVVTSRHRLLRTLSARTARERNSAMRTRLRKIDMGRRNPALGCHRRYGAPGKRLSRLVGP
ncbi:hypothetical protein [Nonomuraea rhizosphaerae]|uniref:hypothetical protein n=1 Tax=Nonomuraea rhizosphaerae TaxID=2665663 RepID=UPI001C601DB4|nr:hypothetical protein [Nonomuraea rhizosphaerae]